jgi:hypothetical protein
LSRRDDPRIGFQDASAAEPLKFLLLQYAEKLRLCRQTHFTDFVEEQRPAGGLLELTRLALYRTGECATLETEQSRLRASVPAAPRSSIAMNGR